MTIMEEVSEVISRLGIPSEDFRMLGSKRASEIVKNIVYRFCEASRMRAVSADGSYDYIRRDLKKSDTVVFFDEEDWLSFWTEERCGIGKSEEVFLCLTEDGDELVCAGCGEAVLSVIKYGAPFGFEGGDFILAAADSSRIIWYCGECDCCQIVYANFY